MLNAVVESCLLFRLQSTVYKELEHATHEAIIPTSLPSHLGRSNALGILSSIPAPLTSITT